MQFNAFVVCFLCAIPLLGQSATDLGQIIGVVKDPDQAVISAAQVTLTSQQTKTKTTAVTDAQGAYRHPLRPKIRLIETRPSAPLNELRAPVLLARAVRLT